MQRLFAVLLLAATAVTAQTNDLYYLVFLRPSPDRKALPQPEADRIQAAHMANIRSMADGGVLVAAGPFDNTPPKISGVFVFRTSSLEEARRIASEDPTVLEHLNTVDVLAWRGPKGIGNEYFRLHKADPKTPDDMGLHPFFLLRRANASATEAHHAYLQELRRNGKIAAAGPVEGDADIAEVVIFRRIPAAEARTLMEADPAVTSGALRLEAHNWWCAAHVLPE